MIVRGTTVAMPAGRIRGQVVRLPLLATGTASLNDVVDDVPDW